MNELSDALVFFGPISVLEDAMAGDATLFAREDYVEEVWRIVDPVVKTDTTLYEYEANKMGSHSRHRLTRQRVAQPGKQRRDCQSPAVA